MQAAQGNERHERCRTKQITGGFWGTLIGLIFLHPLFGLALGAAAGAFAGALTDIGIDDKFMKELSQRVRPGSSVLFVLVRQATPDRVLDEMERLEGRVLHTSLSHEDEQRLRAAIETAEESPARPGDQPAASAITTETP